MTIRWKTCDVLVVGARCAGAATAMLAARRGLRVLVVDRGAYGSDTLSTHALMRGGVLQLRRWGLLPGIVAAGTPEIPSATFDYGGEAVEVAVKPGHGVTSLLAPRRTVLDAALVDAARAAGAEIRHGHTLVELIRGPGERVAGAVVVDPAGRRLEIRADLVVGADGVGSAVARMAGAPVTRQGSHATAAVYGYWQGVAGAGYRWYYGTSASAAAIPTNGGLHCVCLSVTVARFRDGIRRDPVAGFHAGLAEVAPGLASEVARARAAGALVAFAGRRGFMLHPCGPGWALVGDAGYFKDPLTAHGITDALRDAELLADAAVAGTEAAFEAYAETRDALSLPLFEATDALASFAWDMPALRSLHEALNRAMKREVEHLAALPPCAPAPEAVA